jgi:hypothetical protein
MRSCGLVNCSSGYVAGSFATDPFSVLMDSGNITVLEPEVGIGGL